MARRISTGRKLAVTAAAWAVGFVIFFPILWMALTSFKTELEAFARPPSLVFFHWTTANYAAVQTRSDYLHHLVNSIVIAGGSTLIAIVIAIPAAWSLAFAPTKRTRDVLLWILSTKMMPAVGVLVPIYLIYRDTGLLDTRTGLIAILCLGNLPIVIWMLFTYFKEIPRDILEAARMDGATFGRELVYVLMPMTVPGIASTLLASAERSAGVAVTSRNEGCAFGEELTPKEFEVLRLLPTRLSRREIGARLYVSLNNVKTHQRAVYRKLRVEHRSAAVSRARELGLL